MSDSPVLSADEADEDYIACELCREPLHELSVEKRQAHYENHFSNGDGLEINEVDAQLAASLAQGSSPYRGAPTPVTCTFNEQQGTHSLKPRENVFWHAECPSPPPSKIITPGIIPLLQQAIVRSRSGGALCTPLVVHYGTELWDLGWGCGYRNFLMACSALIAQNVRPGYKALLMNDACGPPGVRNLQVWIEDAWRRGYDTHGAAQLRHRLLGTRKWIGTAELYVAFVSRGIPARLVDFPKNGHGMFLDSSSIPVTHSALYLRCSHANLLMDGKAHTALIQWLTAHFLEHADTGSSLNSTQGAYVTTRMPVVLQHKGHSRTVIGVEFAPSGETNLLIYDPARRPSVALRKAGLRVHATNISAVDLHPASASFLAPEQNQRNRRNSSPNKAKDFLKRVIKKRSRTALDEQASKRVRGGSAEPDDWEAMGKGMGRRLGGEDGDQKGSASRGRGMDAPAMDVAQGLDLGRVLSAFRVSASQLGKKDQYQILWFPMTPALTGPERDALKVVRSERVTVSPASGS